MINYSDNNCPICGKPLKKYDVVKRIVRSAYGKKDTITLNRYICRTCGSIHRMIPNNLYPYKQYEKEIIDGFVSGKHSSYDLEYEDYPSESTINRWIYIYKK